MSVWLITAAMHAEAQLLTERMRPAQSLGGRQCFKGDIGGRDMLLVLTGIGMVNAAQAVTAALEAGPPVEAVLNLGCAGAYPESGFSMGQAVLAKEVVFADMGVQSAKNLHGMDKINIPLARGGRGEPIYNQIQCDERLAGLFMKANPGLATGIFATVGRVSGDAQTADQVAQRWRAGVEEMEAAAVGLVAMHYAKPFVAVRGVSNLAGHRELDVELGAEAAQRALLALERTK